MRKISILLFTALLSAAVLTACSSREQMQDSGSVQSSSTAQAEQESSSSVPAAPADPKLDPWNTPQETAQRFQQALLTHNATALQQLTGAESAEVYRPWTEVQFDDISVRTLYEDGQSGRYEFTFAVSKSNVEAFPEGTFKRVVGTGYDAFGENLIVTMLYDENQFCYEQFPYDMEAFGYEAYQFVNEYQTLMGVQPFSSTAELPAETVAEYCIIMLNKEHNFEREQFSVAEVQQMAQQLFGISGFDGTSTKFYNAEDGVYISIGRGGNSPLVTTQKAVYNEASGTYTLDVTLYNDPLRTQAEKTLRYTLKKTEKGLQFVSAVEI